MPPFAGQGLCSGLRDAANLSWKLASVLKGKADSVLLDSYQAEREPHVRTIIDLALMMGRTVCVLDPQAAAQRDYAMLAAQASGGDRPASGVSPPLERGCLSENGGAPFPQLLAKSAGQLLRMDDVLGPSAWLIVRETPAPPISDISFRSVSIEDALLAPFHENLLRWMDAQKADAVLVRPDRYIFGTGNPVELTNAYSGAFREPAGA
jgi:3-(3-hydroxy-phenyl)propionate hydroxylase